MSRCGMIFLALACDLIRTPIAPRVGQPVGANCLIAIVLVEDGGSRISGRLFNRCEARSLIRITISCEFRLV